MKTESYISINVLSKELGLPRAYLRRLAKQGKIPYLRAGNQVRFLIDDVSEALKGLAVKEGAEGVGND